MSRRLPFRTARDPDALPRRNNQRPGCDPDHSDLGLPAAAGPHRTTRLWLALIVGLVIFPVLNFIVLPTADSVRKVDAVVVLGPATPARIAVAQSMAQQGLTEIVVISTELYPGVHNAYDIEVCHSPRSYEVICGHPSPFTTQGEVTWANRLAEARGWSSVAFVTYTPHIARTRLYTERCMRVPSTVLADPSPVRLEEWAQRIPYEMVAFLKATYVTTDC